MNKLVKLMLISACVAILSGCNKGMGGPSNSSSSSQTSTETSSSSSSSSSSSTTTSINSESANAKEVTISQLIAENKGASNTKTLYRVTGIAQWPKNTKYGNFDLLDDTGYIYVYGCSKNQSSITGSSGNYKFTNDSTFGQTGIKPGDEVTIEGLFVWYSYSSNYGVPEFQGYVTKVIKNNASNITASTYTTAEPTDNTGNYYSSISDTDSGSTLLTNLHNLMDTTHTNYVSYSSLANHYKSSDPHSSGGVKCFYSGEKTSSFNKEHVWPQSSSGSSTTQLYGESYGGSDLLHIRPTINTYNSKRGNSYFGPIFGNKNGLGKISYQGGGTTYYTSNVFEPADCIKGDVARIIMYMYVHYSSQIGGNQKSYYGEMNINWVMGPDKTNSFKLLRNWNALDPVDESEITRNNYAQTVQGNRNPFVDHPTYADKIWG